MPLGPFAGAYPRALRSDTREIRVLCCRSPDTLSFAFDYVSLVNGTGRGYAAISWCWGVPEPRRQISVGGVPVLIPKNAFEVITELCIAKKNYRIWIDAVCINQDDLEERSHQVGIMSSIFENAHSTLIWLGTDDGHTSKGVDALQVLLEHRQDQHAHDGHSRCGIACKVRAKHAFPPDLDWLSISAIFASDWFCRVWVIQELVFSKHILMFRGSESFHWTPLAEAANHMVLNQFQNHTDITAGIQGIHNAMTIGKLSKPGRATSLLHNNRAFGATDPKDRAFALYCLLDRDLTTGSNQQVEAIWQACRPDYNKSVAQVYIELTRAALQGDERQRILLYDCGRLVPRLDSIPCSETFPSWVPRYDYVLDLGRGSYLRTENVDTADVTSRVIKIDSSTDPRVLRVAGFHIDTLGDVVGPAEMYDKHAPAAPPDADELLKTLSTFWVMAKASLPRCSDKRYSEMLLATITAGQSLSHASYEIGQDWTRDFCAFVDKYWPDPKPPYQIHEYHSIDSSDTANDPWQSGDSDHESESSSESTGSSRSSERQRASQQTGEHSDDHVDDCDDTYNAKRFLTRAMASCANRTFFVTQESRMGLGARDARKGDLLCLLYGFSVPFVLRQVGHQHYLVGDAYVHMQSDYTDRHADQGAITDQERWFDIV